MDIENFNARLRNEVDLLKDKYRNDNSAFLIWFLINVFCLNEIESVDSVCDGPRDKGIDGIWVDENEEEIYIFQSEFSPNNNIGTGDTKIREFYGIQSWFRNENSVTQLFQGLINEDLKQRMKDLSLIDKVARGYKVNYVYITNKIFDQNANEYLCSTSIESYDNVILFNKFTYMSENEIKNEKKVLSLLNNRYIPYDINENCSSIILSIPASELLKLEGIQDQSLFSRNVRFWTGNTGINKGISKTIENIKEHDKFFLYHNGISIICSNYEFDEEKSTIELSGYQVINGCQSIISFYQNKNNLSDKIQVLVKIIKIESHPDLIKEITKNANSQNSISQKDLKSNDRVQINLQKTFDSVFNGKVLYNIKRGEKTEGYEEIIPIDYAGQLIKAFYFDQPYTTHLKTSFFGDQYEEIFSRNMNCEKIYLAYIIHQLIIENKDMLSNLQMRAYGLSLFSILRIIKNIIEIEEFGQNLINFPREYLQGKRLDFLKKSVSRLFQLVSLDLNDYIEEYIHQNQIFDYKNLFKNKDFCDKLASTTVTNHKKTIIRHPEDAFSEIWRTTALT